MLHLLEPLHMLFHKLVVHSSAPLMMSVPHSLTSSTYLIYLLSQALFTPPICFVVETN